MDKSDSDAKMESILSDAKKFLEMDIAAGPHYTDKSISKVLHFHINGYFINEKLHEQLKPNR